MAEPRRTEPHQPLDAVRDQALPARLEPVADDESNQFSGLSDGMTSLAGGNHASPAHFRLEAVRHHASALVQRVAGTPQIVAPDAVEHGVDALTGEAVDLLHEVRALV